MDDSSQKKQSTTMTKPKEKKKGRFLLNLVFILLFILFVFLLVDYGLKIYTNHGHEITVPDAKGLTINQAISVMKKAGLESIVIDSVYIKNKTPNTICDQSPDAGICIKEGRIIRLTVNSGDAPQITLPDIADNCSLREAMAKLTSLGFKVGPTEFITGEKDWVYEIKCNGHNVGKGSRINIDDTLTLVVGDGTYYGESDEETDQALQDSILTEDINGL